MAVLPLLPPPTSQATLHVSRYYTCSSGLKCKHAPHCIFEPQLGATRVPCKICVVQLKLESTSTFWIWVNHFRNHFTFDIPHSTFQLGSDISISYSLSLAQNSLPISTYTLNAPSSASHPTDSGCTLYFQVWSC